MSTGAPLGLPIGRSNVAFAESLALAHSDESVAADVAQIIHEMRTTACPDHPGTDPVSQHIVLALSALLRGPVGIEQRLRSITNDLQDSSMRLSATAQLYEQTDGQAVGPFSRAGGAQ
jgi:hypothetical protein